MSPRPLELICPAGTPASLKAAVDAGADAVYLGFRDETNARNFPGLNFSREELAEGVAYAKSKGAKVLVAINTYPRAGNPDPWRKAVDDAADLGAWAVILADIGLLDYARQNHPGLRRHLSVQASAANAQAIRFYYEEFYVKRVVLPRVLTTEEIARINRAVDVETEVFAFGGMCVMAEGRCLLSSYATGQSPNIYGVCSPAGFVRYEERAGELVSSLGGFTVNKFGSGEPVGYPTLCKGRFRANLRDSYLFEEPVSLDVTNMLPALMDAGVTALKIEGRQRGKAYVAEVVSAFRRAVDAAALGEQPESAHLSPMTEGGRQSTGAYEKGWR